MPRWVNRGHLILTSERDATAWINAHSNLTKPEDTIDEPQIDLQFNRPGPLR
jgi:hypothetical protein